MNRRNLLAAIVAAVTGVLWRKKPKPPGKKPNPPMPGYMPELLAGLFELKQSADKDYRIGIALNGVWGLDGKFKPPTAVSEEEIKALQIELVKSQGKREILNRLGGMMGDVMPDYVEQLNRFEGWDERKADRIRQQRIEEMRRRVPDSFKEGGCFFTTPQRQAEAKASLREIEQKRLSNRRRLQALAKEKGLLYTGDQS